MPAEEGKKYIGLSLSGCVYDIVKGFIKEEQVDRIIAGTNVSGFEREIIQRTERDIKFIPGLFPSHNQIRQELEERPNGIYENTWDKADQIIKEAEKHVSISTERSSGSWEWLFKNELLWQNGGAEFQSRCIEVATRLIEQGKVYQPRTRGENPPATSPRRWIDCDTAEIKSLITGIDMKPDYLLLLLDPEFQKDDEPVTARSSFR